MRASTGTGFNFFFFFIFFALTLHLFCCSLIPAEAKNERRRLADLSFLQGNWHGITKSGAQVNEYWSEAAGDGMVGYCRFVEKGKTSFLELLTILETTDGILMRMRHFDGEMKAWAEQDEAGDCRLIEMQTNKAVFENGKEASKVKLIYERSADDTLCATVEETKEGKKTVYSFAYKLSR